MSIQQLMSDTELNKLVIAARKEKADWFMAGSSYIYDRGRSSATGTISSVMVPLASKSIQSMIQLWWVVKLVQNLRQVQLQILVVRMLLNKLGELGR